MAWKLEGHDPDVDWRIEDDETVQDIDDLYNRECVASREMLAGISLDAKAGEVSPG